MAKSDLAADAALGMTKAQIARENDFQAEDDHRTLTRAQEVMQDPKRMRGARRHHRKLSRTLKATGRALTGKGRF